MDESKLDDIRKTALEEVSKVEEQFKVGLWFAGIFEATLLLAYLLLMDFDNRLHWLILIATWLSYGTIVIGLFSLADYIKLNTLRVLKAIVYSEFKS